MQNTKSTSFRLVGLKNAIGEQNCFLNVVIQALWRQRACRDFFFSVEDAWKTQNPVLIALTTLFTEYKYSEENILPPDEVRISLAEMFAHLQRFQLGEMDDAGESFEAILTAMHGSDDIDKQCKNRLICLGHQVFALDYVKEQRCEGCKSLKQVGHGTTFTYHLYAQEMVEANQKDIASAIGMLAETKLEKCGKCQQIKVWNYTILLSLPKVCCFNVVWPGIDVDRTLRQQFLKMIGNSQAIDLSKAFLFPDDADIDSVYRMTGMICFYPGAHYVFFGLVSKTEVVPTWVIFDDHSIKQVGSIDQVLERCEKAKYQPVCIFFEKTPANSVLASNRPVSAVKPPIANIRRVDAEPMQPRTRSTVVVDVPPPIYPSEDDNAYLRNLSTVTSTVQASTKRRSTNTSGVGRPTSSGFQ